MSYRVRPTGPVRDDVVRVADEQLDKALTELGDDDHGLHQAIHQSRKRCKKVRALLRLVRPANEDLYERENAALRDAARRVSDLRDATAALETVDLLADGPARDLDLSALRDVLLEDRAALVDRQHAQARVDQVAEDLEAVRRRTHGWQLHEDGAEAILPGLHKTYRRARKRFGDAYEEGTTEAFHEWRKRVKYHRYHVRLLQDTWPPVLGARREQLHELTDLLGDDHDLAELRPRLSRASGRVDEDLLTAAVGIVDRVRAELQQQARPLARRLFADHPDVLTARFRAVWLASRAEEAAPTTPDPVVVPGD